MMRKKSLLLPIIFLLSCNTKQNYLDDFSFDRNAVIEIIITSVETPVDFELYSRTGFPVKESKKAFTINQDTAFELTIPSNIYDLSYLRIGGDMYANIYTIPDDTLKISLDLDDTLSHEERISLDGSASNICKYYEAKRLNWIKTKGFDYYYDSTISVETFTSKMDRNRNNDLKFLWEYCSKHKLPEWFIETERNNIIYQTASSKIGIINYHKRFYNSDFQAPRGYYSFTDELKLNNPEAYLSDAYYGYLSLFYGRNSEIVESGFESNIHRCLETLALIESDGLNLDPVIEDVLLGRRISYLFRDNYLTHSNFQRSDSILELSKQTFNAEDKFMIIKKYRDTQYEKLKSITLLKPGDKAPDFYLPDRHENYVRLSDFSGKMVYLNFWTTYCSPCIATIPDKNRLVEEFSDQEFALINICMDYKTERWVSIIETHDFSGTHLICKGNWSHNLRDSYSIRTVPHYVLIDKEGKLIANKCEKPEDILDELNLLLN